MTQRAQDPGFEARVRASFAHQSLNRLIGAALTGVAPGEVEITLPFREELGQQHGFVHGGVVAAIVDSACGYAALTLTPPDAEVLTVEFKINFLAPAQGDRVIARGRVTRSGRTLSVCAGDVFASKGGEECLIATMLATIMVTSRDRDAPARERSGVAGQPHASSPARHPTRHARRWCVCRGGGLARALREIVS